MKKLLFTAVCIVILQVVNSQTTVTVPPADSTVVTVQPTPKRTIPNKIDLSNRSNDHVVVQYGLDGWSGVVPDSAKPSGFSRHFNAYIMLDKPFKTNPRFSVGLGVGIGSSNMFFERKLVDIKSQATRLPFTNLDSANHFKKYKLTTVYAEAPVELRYSSNPENSNSSFKVALGAKVGQLINAHTKGKTLQSKSGGTINSYIAKENSKKFFNSTRLAVTARVGYGIFSIYGAYQINAFLKDVAGPVIRPYSLGICLSGL
jgi:hypothetical protein